MSNRVTERGWESRRTGGGEGMRDRERGRWRRKRDRKAGKGEETGEGKKEGVEGENWRRSEG